MTGMKKVSISLLLLVILSGCMKTTCTSTSVWTTKCEKKVNWNNPGFTVVRTIVTNGTNLGK